MMRWMLTMMLLYVPQRKVADEATSNEKKPTKSGYLLFDRGDFIHGGPWRTAPDQNVFVKSGS